jgi:hypothetical protein
MPYAGDFKMYPVETFFPVTEAARSKSSTRLLMARRVTWRDLLGQQIGTEKTIKKDNVQSQAAPRQAGYMARLTSVIT